MRARKSIEIKTLVDKVNHMNRESTCESLIRTGWNELLEDALHAIGAYEGYTYLTDKEVPLNHKPGVIKTDSGNIFPDETRRHYFLKT